jgi:transcriptional regulator with XRE-family HTH domain
MDWYYRELGGRIRQARGKRWTQSELAARAGLTRSAMANIELGRQRVALDVFERLARALELDPVLLLPRREADPMDERLAQLSHKEREAVLRVMDRVGATEEALAEG